MFQELQERSVEVDSVQLFWIVLEEAVLHRCSAGLNDEVKIVLVTFFPWK